MKSAFEKKAPAGSGAGLLFNGKSKTVRALDHGWQFACKVATGGKVLQDSTAVLRRPNAP